MTLMQEADIQILMVLKYCFIGVALVLGLKVFSEILILITKNEKESRIESNYDDGYVLVRKSSKKYYRFKRVK